MQRSTAEKASASANGKAPTVKVSKHDRDEGGFLQWRLPARCMEAAPHGLSRMEWQTARCQEMLPPLRRIIFRNDNSHAHAFRAGVHFRRPGEHQPKHGRRAACATSAASWTNRDRTAHRGQHALARIQSPNLKAQSPKLKAQSSKLKAQRATHNAQRARPTQSLSQTNISRPLPQLTAPSHDQPALDLGCWLRLVRNVNVLTVIQICCYSKSS